MARSGRRRVVPLLLLSVLLLAAAAPAAIAKKPDTVVGSGSGNNFELSVNAVGSKKSTAGTGSVSVTIFSLATTFVGHVTCVNVEGDLAAVSGTLDPNPFAPAFSLYIDDDPTGDLLQFQLVGFAGECSTQAPFSPAKLLQGDLVLTDGRS